jgi:hypothetical protein
MAYYIGGTPGAVTGTVSVVTTGSLCATVTP